MDVINQNPFRITGILSNASTKDTHRQKNKIRAYTKVGKELVFSVDFSILDKVTRTVENTNKAFSNLEQNKDRVNYALFWFINANPYDEAALGHLEKGNWEKAEEIWTKVALDRSITISNYSSYSNVGTLKLTSSNTYELQKGIDAKFELLNSTFINNFTELVADETYIVERELLKQQFANELIGQLKKSFSTDRIIQLFSNCDETIRKYINQQFTESPIHNIEVSLESSKRKRKESSRNSNTIGDELYKSTQSDINTLKQLLGDSNLQYKMLADNLAKEILQCGIDYFQYWKDSIDPSASVLELFRKADKVAVGKQTKNRIQENISGINDWKSSKLIEGDIGYVVEYLNGFGQKSATIDNAKALINNCKPKLKNIRDTLGIQDEFYLQISGAVVNNALGMSIEVVNKAQENIEYNQQRLLRLSTIVKNTRILMNSMSNMDMEYEIRVRYEENKKAIINLDNQLETVRLQLNRARSTTSSYSSSPTSSSSSSSNDGCYIATMVYGNYDHSQVIELRIFRDTVLRKSKLGNVFIKYYYKYSPSLVQKLKNQELINKIIKFILDGFIKIIK